MECPKCGWVHFAVDEAYVKEWEADWARIWPTLDESGRAAYGLPDGPPTRDSFLKCFRCGNSDRAAFFVTTKYLNGQTIQPILIDAP
mgnify:CR=1 FL=1